MPHEASEVLSGIFLCRICVLSPCWCGSPFGALVSTHSPVAHTIGDSKLDPESVNKSVFLWVPSECQCPWFCPCLIPKPWDRLQSL